MPSPGEGDKLSFERDIRPLFRANDRDSMMAAFDLLSQRGPAADGAAGPRSVRGERAAGTQHHERDDARRTG
jgi:hypothetical protein